MHTLNPTHDPAARSWLASANGHPEFPIQNLPFAEFSHGADKSTTRGGVAMGDLVLDLAALGATDLLPADARAACQSATDGPRNKTRSSIAKAADWATPT
jgi:fumarylacetoacetase